MKFQLYCELGGQWRWQFKASNGRIMARGVQGYNTQAQAMRAVRAFERQMTSRAPACLIEDLGVTKESEPKIIRPITHILRGDPT